PDELWLAIRQYLTRMQQLDAEVGLSMAERLAGELAVRTGVPVPPGVPAAAYLAGVVNERQARDARRVFTAAQADPLGQGGVGVGSNPVGVMGPAWADSSVAPHDTVPPLAPAVPAAPGEPGVSETEEPGNRKPGTGFAPPA
ncbi:RDD family protein, partial [Streptomyces sp. NPDC059744]